VYTILTMYLPQHNRVEYFISYAVYEHRMPNLRNIIWIKYVFPAKAIPVNRNTYLFVTFRQRHAVYYIVCKTKNKKQNQLRLFPVAHFLMSDPTAAPCSRTRQNGVERGVLSSGILSSSFLLRHVRIATCDNRVAIA